jgi:hypothetical protein
MNKHRSTLWPALPSARSAFLAIALSVLFFACGRSPAESGGRSALTGLPAREGFVVHQTDRPCLVDGRLEESFWKSAERLGGFRVDSNPGRMPAVATEVLLAYGKDALFAAFVLKEPPRPQGTEGGDLCEISIFSRPETPFYSPYLQRLDYKNANESVRTMRRFEVSSSNARRQANVSKVGPHAPYIIDYAWKSGWQTAVAVGKETVVIEAAIPWADIGGLPNAGDTFRINFVRARQTPEGGTERDWFNWYAGPNIRVEPWASENFIQEYPTIFASARFEDGRAVLTRFVETEDPWSVPREHAEYAKLLTGRPDPNRSVHFYLGLSSFLLSDRIKKLYDPKTWEAEEANMMAEFGEAGANGPFLPAFLEKAGSARLAELNRRWGMRFSLHGYADSKEAIKQGAAILTPGGTAAFFDPVMIKLKHKLLESFLQKYAGAPWLEDVWGQDEPFNQISTILQPGIYERVNADLQKEFGLELGVPAGIPNLAYERQPVQAESRMLPDRRAALSRIAMFRWMNKTYAEVARGERGIVRRLAPGKAFQAFNRNSVADLDFLDQSRLWDQTDYFSADPYPSFCIYVYGPERSRYHVGFTSKLVTDLAAGKPTQMIVQGCEMIQRLSTVENVREWASQAAKAGVSKLDWWGTPRLNYPDVYREMVRISKLWKSLPALDIPARSDVAVLFSDDARAGAGDEGLQAHYTLHVLLGENLGAAFHFVSENHVRKGLHSLEGKKLILAPELGYLSKPFAAEILRRVKEGAVLVVLDPDAFLYDIESGPLDDVRREILGTGMPAKREAAELFPTAQAKARFKVGKPLPLRPLPIVGATQNARTLEPPPGAVVLFTYADGAPAAYSRQVGQGEVIAFGAMPFWDSELALRPEGWETWLASLLDELRIPRGLPIWKFLFPATGGEVKIQAPLVRIPGQ